jgi:hypothetical protein
MIAVSGCSDSSFDLTAAPVAVADYPAQALTWNQTASASTAIGCVITGFNEDSFESARITGISGSTVTATFAHPHGASDQWGIIAIAPAYNTFGHHDIENIAAVSQGAPFGVSRLRM